MARLRAEPPSTVGDIEVARAVDFAIGAGERPSYLGATNLIELDLGDMGRVLARPSGTEPKLKIYVDLTTEFPRDGAWQPAEAELIAKANTVGQELASWLMKAMPAT
jgi:phosphomannomutase